MDPLRELSSQSGDKTQGANHRVAERVVAEPELIERLVQGLASPDNALVGDAAEVLSFVAEQRPELVAPHAERLLPLLDRRHTRSRWEGMKALSLVADRVPELLDPLLPRLATLLEEDASVIVRDHAVDTLAAYGTTGPERLQRALPLLQMALMVSEGRFAARALRGFARLAPLDPSLHPRLTVLAEAYRDHGRASVRTAARQLLRATRGA